MTLTTQQIQAGTGATAARAALWHPHLHIACALFTIDSPRRLAAFLAQIGHESGRLVYVREIWGPTAAQKRYMGRGLIQTTGRANYRATRDGLRQLAQPSADMTHVPDFEDQPELLEQPQWAALSAAWYWHSRNLNVLADAGDFEGITRKINGGLNGQADRLALYRIAMEALA